MKLLETLVTQVDMSRSDDGWSGLVIGAELKFPLWKEGDIVVVEVSLLKRPRKKSKK